MSFSRARAELLIDRLALKKSVKLQFTPMMRLVLVGLFALSAIGCTAQTAPNTPPQASNSVPTSTNSPVQQPSEHSTYSSTKFGFRFAYPNDYVVDASRENQPIQYTGAQGMIEIWKDSDYEAIQAQAFEAGTEYPANISIEVFDNADRQPLTHWKGELSQTDRPLTVAGQDAITYASTGLYEQDNVLLFTPNGQQVIRLSVGYIDAADPMRQVFQEIVSNFTFIENE